MLTGNESPHSVRKVLVCAQDPLSSYRALKEGPKPCPIHATITSHASHRKVLTGAAGSRLVQGQRFADFNFSKAKSTTEAVRKPTLEQVTESWEDCLSLGLFVHTTKGTQVTPARATIPNTHP